MELCRRQLRLFSSYEWWTRGVRCSPRRCQSIAAIGLAAGLEQRAARCGRCEMLRSVIQLHRDLQGAAALPDAAIESRRLVAPSQPGEPDCMWALELPC